MFMLIVALTGGIAAGKSVVAALLKERGCFVHSADRVAHNLIKPGRPAWREAVAHFGRGILNPDQSIDRAKLGKIVFSDPEARKFLNGLIHPLILRKKMEAIRRLEREGRYRIFVSEAALTVESGFAPFFDRIVAVDCPKRVQVRRLMERDGIPRREALKKIGSQMPSEQKIKFADYIIDTSGTLAETAGQTARVYRALLADFRKKQKEGKSAAGIKRSDRRPAAGS
jgi:dephospho-CoA kinase